jgi:hypothetical protein
MQMTFLLLTRDAHTLSDEPVDLKTVTFMSLLENETPKLEEILTHWKAKRSRSNFQDEADDR